MRFHGFALAACLAIPLLVATSHAAPLQGGYTIGGSSPDFATFTDATTALLAEGVDGPVTFHVRPGTYEPAVAGEPVIDIPQDIAGVSSWARITFRPDAGTGGTVDNVVLQVSSGAAAIPVALLAEIHSDYVRLETLTFRFADGSVVGRLGRDLIVFGTVSGGTDLHGAAVTGCRFFGAAAAGRAHAAISVRSENFDVELVDNEIDSTTVGISLTAANSIRSSHAPVVRGNSIRGMALWTTGASAQVGWAIDLGTSYDGVVSGNHIDYRSGASGEHAVSIYNPSNLIVDGNTIIGPNGGGGSGPADGFSGIYIFAQSSFGAQRATVTNNMISRIATNFARPLWIVCDSVHIAHNTVIGWPRFVGIRSGPLRLDGTGCTVINNILCELDDHPSFVFAMVIADTAGNVFDFNDLHATSGGTVRANNIDYPTLAAWQATGNDLNSIELMPQFVNNATDLHLAGCSPSDPALRGSGAANVVRDIDGEPRSAFDPVMGADETDALGTPNFAPPVAFQSGASSWLMTAALLDGDADLDLALTNSPFNNGSNDVTLLFNDGNGVFGAPVHLPFVNQPDVVKAGHLNNDAFVDLVVSSEISDSLVVRFGTGGGAFGPPVRVDNGTAVTDFELVDYDDDGDVDIIMLVSPAADSGYVNIRINDGNGSFTWNNVAAAGVFLDDLEIGFFNGDIYPDLAITDVTQSASVYVLLNLGVIAPGVSNGFAAPDIYPAQAHSEPASSRFMVGDFDGDLIVDLMLGDAASLDSLVLLGGNGDGTFKPRRGIYVSSTRTVRVAAALDFEGDGDLDVVTANNTNDLHLLLNDGAGNFQLQYLCDGGLIELAGFPRVIVAAPLDGDAFPDVAVLSLVDTVEVLKNVHFVTVGVPVAATAARPRIELAQSVPNPVRSLGTIAFRLPRDGHVRLEVFNVTGQRVALLVNRPLSAGRHTATLDGRRLPSGAYFYRISAGGHAASRKLMLVR